MTKKLKSVTAAVFILLLAAAVSKFMFDRRVEAGVLAIKTGDGFSAIQKLTLTANLGSRTSQELVAYVYACEDSGVPYDLEKSLFWLRRISDAQSLRDDKNSIKTAANCLKH